jgi:hypothetical protein
MHSDPDFNIWPINSIFFDPVNLIECQYSQENEVVGQAEPQIRI